MRKLLEETKHLQEFTTLADDIALTKGLVAIRNRGGSIWVFTPYNEFYVEFADGRWVVYDAHGTEVGDRPFPRSSGPGAVSRYFNEIWPGWQFGGMGESKQLKEAQLLKAERIVTYLGLERDNEDKMIHVFTDDDSNEVYRLTPDQISVPTLRTWGAYKFTNNIIKNLMEARQLKEFLKEKMLSIQKGDKILDPATDITHVVNQTIQVYIVPYYRGKSNEIYFSFFNPDNSLIYQFKNNPINGWPDDKNHWLKLFKTWQYIGSLKEFRIDKNNLKEQHSQPTPAERSYASWHLAGVIGDLLKTNENTAAEIVRQYVKRELD